ncbi:MAG: YdcF family protein [Alphaproteobacteria bacterium]|nr:YdcF family protein [Alphaproteobacteria bacterium]
MKKLAYISLFFCSIFFSLWFGGFLAFNQKIYAFKIDKETKTDAIVVLTGGKYRLHEAMTLLNENLAENLFISGVDKKISLQKIININNVPEIDFEKIAIGNEATNTVENAIEVDNWIKKNNIKSIRLVTSNYHIFRSLEEIKARNKNISIILHPVYSDSISRKWWKDWKSFYFIASEYNKFLYVYLKTFF